MSHEDDINDILADRERILVAAWMLPNEGPLTEVQRKAAMGNFVDYIRRNNMTPADVTRQVDRPKAPRITELIKGVYRADADDHIRKLNLFIEQHARARGTALMDRFVSTKVAKDMLTVARLVHSNRTMGLVIGPTGIGKSRCALAIHDKYVGSIYCCIMRGYHHPKGLTQKLAIGLGVRGQYTCMRNIIYTTQLERVVDTLRDSNRLVIIDEAHKLIDEAVELCREIHDATGVPFLLLATRDLHNRILRNADPDHGQLYSRFDVVQHLTEGHDVYHGGRALYTVTDIRALYDEPPIKLSKDGARYLQDVANELGRGSLRRCRILLQNGARRARKRQGLADGEQVTVTADDLDWVERHLRRESAEQEAVRDRRKRAARAETA